MKQLSIVLGETTSDVHVYVDQELIGFIQDIKIHAGVASKIPEIEIVFPDLRAISKEVAEKVSQQVEKVKGVPHVQVKLEKPNMRK